jgi:hypothetical protein
VLPGYHLNKRHWNTVIIDGSLPEQMIKDMIEDSYDLVVSKLPPGAFMGDRPWGTGTEIGRPVPLIGSRTRCRLRARARFVQPGSRRC